MAVALRRESRMSVPEYRDWLDARPEQERWELLGGEPRLEAPPSERHQRIVANLIRHLGNLADPRGCFAVPGIAVLSEAMDDFAPIPDVVIRCGPPLPDGYASDPVIVAEVLAPSTISVDRGRKTDFYRALPSLRAFLIVYEDEERVELWFRESKTGWSMQPLGPLNSLTLPSFEGALRVASIYAGLAR